MTVVILLLSIILSYYDYKEREKLLAEQHKLEAQQEYVKNLEGFVATLRKERHDYANHLNTLQLICKLRNADSLDRVDAYLQELTTNIHSSYQSFSTGNDYINALLAVKSNFASENNICIISDYKESIYKLGIADSDLISILGNIIDNSFDALLSDKGNMDKKVTISTRVEDQKYVISVANNGPQIPEKNIKRIFDSGFSTKSNKKDRGFGLHLVRQNVMKNKGTIKVASSEGETRFDIEFELIGQDKLNFNKDAFIWEQECSSTAEHP